MSKTQIRDNLAQTLISLDCKVSVDQNSICIERHRFDNSSQQPLVMTSAVQNISTQNGSNLYLYITEQYNMAGEVEKYTITVNDEKGQSLRSYDLDTKRGKHYHVFTNDDKSDKHIPQDLSIEQIAKKIIEIA